MITIREELRQFLPVLTESERMSLKQDIQENGCLDSLKVCFIEGSQVLIDGHNRYEICSELDINYDVVVIDTIVTLEDAEEWILKNQIGRRNLNKFQRSYYRGELYNRLKKKHGAENGGRGNQYTKENLVSGQNDHLPNSKTSESIAESMGVSEVTVRRDEQLAIALNELSEIDSTFKKEILNGTITLTKKEVTDLGGILDYVDVVGEAIAKIRKTENPNECKEIIRLAVKEAKGIEQQIKEQEQETKAMVDEDYQEVIVESNYEDKDEVIEYENESIELDLTGHEDTIANDNTNRVIENERTEQLETIARAVNTELESQEYPEEKREQERQERRRQIKEELSTKQGIYTLKDNNYEIHTWYNQSRSKMNESGESIDWAWHTWNPVTGCLHTCPYCLDPETLILMANGSTKQIKDIKIGDEIVGVEKGETYHILKKTKVLNHWWTYKQAYEIKMKNGKTLIASGDHRFLSNRGWKYVTGAMSGINQRPYLTTSNKILGIGSLIESSGIFSHDYKIGYLSGILYGDSHIGVHDYRNSIKPRPNGKLYQFRLAMKDSVAIKRTYAFLLDIGIKTIQFQFNDGNGNLYDAIRTNKKSVVEELSLLKHKWDSLDKLNKDFWLGFLAGFFDAEGSYSQGILRLSNTNKQLLTKLEEATSSYFNWAWDKVKIGVNKPVHTIRIKGGLSESIKFFNLTNPAISRKFVIDKMAVKGQGGSQIVSIKPIGYRHLVDITTGTETFIANGFVSHNCYARDIATSDRMAGIYPKQFAPTFHPSRLISPKITTNYTREKIEAKAKQRKLPLELAEVWAKNVFVCSMADLFGKWVPDEWILHVFDSVIKYNNWNYLFLTKYPQRLEYIGQLLGGSFPDNCWVGTTVDEQKRVKIAQNAFANIQAPVKWLSLEPLLTNLDFTDLGMFDMVAIGGQSANSQVPAFQPEWDWVENIIWQARQSKTKIYFKENLHCRPKEMPIIKTFNKEIAF